MNEAAERTLAAQERSGLRLDSELHLMLLNDNGKLTRDERDLLKRARDSLTEMRTALEHIVKEAGDEPDSGAFARDMARRALRSGREK